VRSKSSSQAYQKTHPHPIVAHRFLKQKLSPVIGVDIEHLEKENAELKAEIAQLRKNVAALEKVRLF
jgi:DNA gyrase/topoisomerase IV subunit A